MRKQWALACAAAFGLTITACAPRLEPLDTASLPTAVTSATAQYITTNDDVPARADTVAQNATTAAPAATEAGTAPAATLPASVTSVDVRTATCPRPHCWRSWLVPRPNEMPTAATSVVPFADPKKALPDVQQSPGNAATFSSDMASSAPGAPVAMWAERLRPRVKLDYPRTKNLSVVGLVLDGVATAQPSEGGQLAALKPWSLFFAPGCGVTIHADANPATVLLLAYATEATLEQALAILKKSETAVFWDKRPGTWTVHDLERAVPQRLADTKSFVWTATAPGMPVVEVLRVEGQTSLKAKHDAFWNALAPLQGAALLTSTHDSAPDPQARPLRANPGDLVILSGNITVTGEAVWYGVRATLPK